MISIQNCVILCIDQLNSVTSLMQESNDLLEGCKRNNRDAQKKLYAKHSVKLMGICMRYTRNKSDAEDLLQEVFVKIFKQIKKFKGTGSFEGWLCRIAVNTAITNYHKNKVHKDTGNVDDYSDQLFDYETITDKLSTNELLEVINRLPEIYKVVFNLYAIEGYTHKEIAEQLNISEGTSKSQLSRARKLLQNMLQELYVIKNDTRVE